MRGMRERLKKNCVYDSPRSSHNQFSVPLVSTMPLLNRLLLCVKGKKREANDYAVTIRFVCVCVCE